MKEETSQLEALVRDIVRRHLADRDVAPFAPVVAKSVEVKPSLSVAARVVSLAELNGRLEGVAHVVVPAGAVITPAARDLLRERRVAVTYRTKEAAAKGKNSSCLLAAVATTNLAATVEALTRQGFEIERLVENDLVTCVAAVSKRLSQGQPQAVMLADEPAAAACLANRHAHVRAAVSDTVRSVDRAAEAIGANLLVIETRAKSVADIVAMAAAFYRGGPRPCPAPYRQALA